MIEEAEGEASALGNYEIGKLSFQKISDPPAGGGEICLESTASLCFYRNNKCNGKMAMLIVAVDPRYFFFRYAPEKILG